MQKPLSRFKIFQYVFDYLYDHTIENIDKDILITTRMDYVSTIHTFLLKKNNETYF